jgi:amino acid transporter
MGRSNALPRSFFGAVDPVRRVPRNNVIFVGLVALLGAFLLSYSLAAEMLNFGALLAFIGVNAAAFVRYFARASAKRLANLAVPISGLTICLLLWLNLSHAAMLAGVIWMAVGIAFGAWKTHGFRTDLINFEIPSGAEI